MFWLLTVIILLMPLVWFFTDPGTHYLKLKSIAFDLLGLFILFLTFVSIRYFPWPPTVLDRFIKIAGMLSFFAGLLLAVWAKLEMKSKWGLPGELDPKRQNKIITTGPFAFSRNPIYTGLVLLTLGYALALRSYTIVFVPIMIFYFYNIVLKEEKILTKHFGKEYLGYKSKVRRFI